MKFIMGLEKSRRFIIILGSFIFVAFVISAFSSHLQNEKLSYQQNMPKEGVVPDAETAIKVAEAIWLPVFGDKIYENKPFKANLKDGVWIVEGTLPAGYKGGTPYIEIQKSDCKILKITHGK